MMRNSEGPIMEQKNSDDERTPGLEAERLPGGYTLSEWQDLARRDDCLKRMVQSDLRQLLGIIERQRKALNSFTSLREALAEGRQAAVNLASMMREGAHDKEEIKWCKVVDNIDAALNGVTQPATPNENCTACGGFGCVDDDPEVRGAVAECWKCGGSGKAQPAIRYPEETGWLVEMNDAGPKYYSFAESDPDDPWGGFQREASKATRFARKEDAEALIAAFGWTPGHVYASEHVWGGTGVRG